MQLKSHGIKLTGFGGLVRLFVKTDPSSMHKHLALAMDSIFGRGSLQSKCDRAQRHMKNASQLYVSCSEEEKVHFDVVDKIISEYGTFHYNFND